MIPGSKICAEYNNPIFHNKSAEGLFMRRMRIVRHEDCAVSRVDTRIGRQESESAKGPRKALNGALQCSLSSRREIGECPSDNGLACNERDAEHRKAIY
jgi:hypothetical protein